MFIVEPVWNKTKEYQMIGRVIRTHSHKFTRHKSVNIWKLCLVGEGTTTTDSSMYALIAKKNGVMDYATRNYIVPLSIEANGNSCPCLAPEIMVPTKAKETEKYVQLLTS